MGRADLVIRGDTVVKDRYGIAPRKATRADRAKADLVLPGLLRHVLVGALTVVALGTILDLLVEPARSWWGILVVVLCGYVAMFASAALADKRERRS
jgi:hypothetical protein